MRYSEFGLSRLELNEPTTSYFFFFFQEEDGIRDFHVTGVQTCALPILGINRDIRMLDAFIRPPGTARGPCPRAFSAVEATTSGVTVPGARRCFARASPGVSTAPATHATTSTPLPRSSAHKPSASTAPNAFVAAYVAMP